MPYQYLENIAIADVAFEASGKSREELFIACADATMNVMVEDLKTIAAKERRDICVEEETLEMVLFEFLQKFIYHKDAEQLLLRVAAVRIIEERDRWVLTAKASGELLNRHRHRLNVDVKAVTLHQFRITETKGQWQARVVLDI